MPTPTTSSDSKMNTSGNTQASAGSQKPQSIKDALGYLDRAISKDGANLSDLLTHEYSNLKAAIDEMAPRMKETVRQYGEQAAQAVQSYAVEGMERGRVLANKVDAKVRSNPWPVIGTVALSSIAVGYLLGRSRPVTSTPEFH